MQTPKIENISIWPLQQIIGINALSEQEHIYDKHIIEHVKLNSIPYAC